eukprot:2352036-Amphidinium_carterae.1
MLSNHHEVDLVCRPFGMLPGVEAGGVERKHKCVYKAHAADCAVLQDVYGPAMVGCDSANSLSRRLKSPSRKTSSELGMFLIA